MGDREELLSIVKENNLEKFVAFIGECKNKNVDLSQLLCVFTKKQLEVLWDGIQQTCISTLLSVELVEDNEEDDDNKLIMNRILDVLDCVISVASATIHQEEPYIPPCLQSTASILHGLLLVMPEDAEQLKDNTAKLFEFWWLKDLPGKNNITMNTLIYLLQRSLSLDTIKEVKRVWSLHEVLSSVDMSNESSGLIKELITKCVIKPNYLKSSEGCRFLGFVMGIDAQLTEDLHRTIKKHIPTARSSWLSCYGEIYFRGWQRATGPVLQKLEMDCIQDLMYHAVHADKSIGSNLRQLLGYIHMQKKKENVDEMLLRLYEPFLWRSLKVANPLVRCNAATLLIDVFPLNDSKLGVEEADKLLQKQFDTLQILLDDPFPSVRSITVKGIFRILDTFWEIIPPDTLKNIIAKMIQELVWDSASAEVRVNVVKGLSLLLSNPLCHPLLKPILPQLHNHIHDTAEVVRVAMMELLLKVKGIRTIKYWNIVPIEHLLLRLEIDSNPVKRRIMKILFPSFLPLDKSTDVQLDRCMALIQSNPGAARNFFRDTPKHMSTENTAQYMILLVQYVLKRIFAERKNVGTENSENLQEQQEQSAEEEEEGDDDISIHNTKVMRGLVEVMVILWTEIYDNLQKKDNKDILDNLVKKFSIGVSEMMNTFEDPEICSVLVKLAGFLPSGSVPNIRRSCLSKLRKMTEQSTPEDYSSFLQAMCNWGKAGEVIEMAEEWIDAGLNKSQNINKIDKKSRKSVGFVLPQEDRPILGMEMVSFMLQHVACHSTLMRNHIPSLLHLKETLENVLHNIEESVKADEACDDEDFLMSGFTLYCTLTVLLHNKETENAVERFEQMLTWADTELLPCLCADVPDTLPGGRKRSFAKGNDQSNALVLHVTKTLLSMCSDIMLTGIGRLGFSTKLSEFCVQCLQTNEVSSLFSEIFKCLYQILDQILVSDHKTDDVIKSCEHTVMKLFGKILFVFATGLQEDRESTLKILIRITEDMSKFFSLLYRSPMSDTSLQEEVMGVVTGAVVAEIQNTTEQLDSEDIEDGDIELPPLTSCLMDTVCKKNNISRHFTAELSKCIESGAATGMCTAAGRHLLNKLANNKQKMVGMDDCLNALQKQMDDIVIKTEIDR